jgi:hypothetical protein
MAAAPASPRLAPRAGGPLLVAPAGLCFLALAGLLSIAPACFILDNDDDGTETGNDTGTASGSGSGSGTANESGSGSGTASESGSAEASTAADETAAGGVCGWGPTGDPMVPDGYVCGGDGEDPDGMFPMLCPEVIELQVGGACSGIEGPGCCDAQGNAWFCGDDGNGPALARIAC